MVIAAAAFTFSTAACSGGSTSSVRPRPTLTLRATTPHATILVEQQRVPNIALTSDQKQRVTEIIEADPVVGELIDGSTMFVEHIGAYFDGTDPETGKDLLVGGVAHITLSRPVTHERFEVTAAGRRPYYAQWPDELQSRYPPHFTGSSSLSRLKNIEKFDVNVEFDFMRVVYIYFPLGSTDEVAEYIGEKPPFDLQELISNGGRDFDAVKTVVESDPAVAAILEAMDPDQTYGTTYDLGEHKFGYYHAQAEDGLELEGDWPEIIDGDKTTGDYRSETIHIVEDFVREVSVTVDMDIGKVIGITTSEGD
jgi:hypothetical protein